MKSIKVSNERKQTLIFLSLAKKVKAVTFVSKVSINKNAFKYITALLVKSISLAFKDYPHLNCMMQYGYFNRLLYLDKVSARLTVSKTEKNIEGVYSYMIDNSDNKTIGAIQDEIQKIKSIPLNQSPFYHQLQLLQKLPLIIGKLFVKLLLLQKKKQSALWGSFTLTSLGKDSQFACFPISGSTFTFTLGAPQVVDDKTYECNLVMVFDHRVLDGLQASRFLNKIKENLMFLQNGSLS